MVRDAHPTSGPETDSIAAIDRVLRRVRTAHRPGQGAPSDQLYFPRFLEDSKTMAKIGYLGSLLRDVFQFARQNKVYWIVPFVLVLGLLVLLVVTSQATAPFIYTLF